MDTQVIITAGMMILAMPVAVAQNVPSPDATGKAKDTFVAQSSRKIFGDDKLEWIEKQRALLPMAKRQIGPFGMPQDPNKTVVRKVKARPKPGAFINAIKAMKINTVMASEGKFAIGSREFRTGDALPIIRGARQFNIKIVRVRSDHIIFLNVDSGEYVKRNLNALPPGVSRSASIMSVPGVIPASKRDDSPLHLDSPTIPASTRRE